MPDDILVVDDDPVQRRLLTAAVERLGHRAVTAENGAQAMEILQGSDSRDISLLILDLVMPELDGMGVLERMRQAEIALPVIVQTAHGGIDAVVSAMRAGAADFVVKPCAPERLQVSIENALKLRALEGTVARLSRSAEGALGFGDIITRSETMQRVIRLGERAATSNIPVLIEGESGVGKELVARAIQGTGDRRRRPFVTVNCAAIPEKLVESILFGHEKGSFTGASESYAGKFREADGGTLFLDEVGELAPDIQVKLLRALQDGEVDPVGSRRPVKVDIRLISATNRDLVELTRLGQFREDLFYRLNVFPIRLPPLRQRRADIPELVRHFTARFAAEEGKTRLRGVDAEAMALLSAHDWPGNIRQLENAVFRAVVLSDGAMLTPGEFPQIAGRHDEGAVPSPGTALPPATSITIEPFAEAGRAPPLADPGHGPAIAATGDDGEPRALQEIEADMIRFAIGHCGGRMTRVARSLGIGRSTLYRKLKEYGISDTPGRILAE